MDKWWVASRCKRTDRSTLANLKMDCITEEESSSTLKECLRDSSRQARRSTALLKNQYQFPKEKTTLTVEGIDKILPTGVQRRTWMDHEQNTSNFLRIKSIPSMDLSIFNPTCSSIIMRRKDKVTTDTMISLEISAIPWTMRSASSDSILKQKPPQPRKHQKWLPFA